MPIYEYRCSDCQQVFEEWQKSYEDRTRYCPICGGVSNRLISNAAFVLKGSGWYVTDYCNRRSETGNGNGKAAAGETKSAPESSSASTTTESSSGTSKDSTKST